MTRIKGELINPANKEIAHSFKGKQLETILLYRFVIYIGLLEKFVTRDPKLAEIHDDLSENMRC